MIEGDALLALVRAENHRASDDERLASLRQLGIATNSLAVLDDYLRNASENWYSSQAFPPPYSLLGRDEGPPSDDELAPLGGEATGFELITQVYEPADRRTAHGGRLRVGEEPAQCEDTQGPRAGRERARRALRVVPSRRSSARRTSTQILGRRLRFSDAEGQRRRRCRAGRSSSATPTFLRRRQLEAARRREDARPRPARPRFA